MGTRIRPSDAGIAEAQRLALAAGTEIRHTRVALGLSLSTVAGIAAMSTAQLSRIERGKVTCPTLDQLCRALQAVGLTSSFTHYPSGIEPRDAAQLRLLGDLEELLTGALRMRREVTLPIPGDLRAWDAAITDGRATVFVEGETHLGDVQAMARRYAAKLRDDPRGSVLIIVVRRTARNVRILREHREALRADFPLDGGAILRALRAGRLPTASGIVLL